MNTTLQMEIKAKPMSAFILVRSGLLQRKCACGGTPGPTGECEACRKKREKATLQRATSHAAVVNTVPPIVHDVLRSPGQSLDPATRAFMEPRFGHDFSGVRVHTDGKAAESARAVNALAYTVGRNVVFGSGQYMPGIREGKKLLAHELAHVVQQGNAGSSLVQKQTESDEEIDIFEVEAEEVANKVIALSDTAAEKSAETKSTKKKAPPNPCARTILAEGTCEFLVKNSKWVCCDPENGIEYPKRTKSAAEPGKECPSKKWTPIFTCDAKCDNALEKGCDDDDNWMAIPGNDFSYNKCDDLYTICANGKQTTGYVRDRSVTANKYEVSPGIQKSLGVKVGSSFAGSIYRPGAKQDTIDKDKCCKD